MKEICTLKILLNISHLCCSPLLSTVNGFYNAYKMYTQMTAFSTTRALALILRSFVLLLFDWSLVGFFCWNYVCLESREGILGNTCMRSCSRQLVLCHLALYAHISLIQQVPRDVVIVKSLFLHWPRKSHYLGLKRSALLIQWLSGTFLQSSDIFLLSKKPREPAFGDHLPSYLLSFKQQNTPRIFFCLLCFILKYMFYIFTKCFGSRQNIKLYFAPPYMNFNNQLYT